MAQTEIKDGMVVDLAYVLTSETGEVLDRADLNDPFTYLHGAGQIVPGLEEALDGCKVGDKKKVRVEAEDGYGEFDPALKMSVKKDQFPKDMKLDVGMQFETVAQDGMGMIFTVAGIEGDQVSVDGNHPLAGQVLNFDVEVLKMRAATPDEMEHGHAHGPDGHHH